MVYLLIVKKNRFYKSESVFFYDNPENVSLYYSNANDQWFNLIILNIN